MSYMPEYQSLPTPVRADGTTLHVDFEQVSDTLIIARNAGVVLDFQTPARILDNYGYDGQRCACITANGAGEAARIRLLRGCDSPMATEDAVVEFVFRVTRSQPIDLVNWPIVSFFSSASVTRSYKPRNLDHPVFDDPTMEAADGRPRAVLLGLRASGLAREGTYRIDVSDRHAVVAGVAEGLPQAAWLRFILHRQRPRVSLFIGRPGREQYVGSYEDRWSQGEVYAVLLGNPAGPQVQGSGYWDCVRIGKPLRQGAAVAPPEKRTRHVSEVAPRPPAALAVGREKVLLIDDWAVEETRNIERAFHRPRKHPSNPLIQADQPWESEAIYLTGGVERSEAGYRMWYHAAEPTAENRKNSHVCIATSRDGIHWMKPPLGIHTHGGSLQNNISIMGCGGPHSVIYTPDDPRGVEFRYKTHTRDRRGHVAWTSSDGVHWTCQGPFLSQSYDASSTHYDPVRQKYVASLKLGYKGRRYRGYAESDDFLDWTDSYLMLDVDELDEFGDQIYALSIFRYESLYLGLCKVYHVQTTDTCDIHLAVSHNAMHWERPFRIQRAPDFAVKEHNDCISWGETDRQPFIPTGLAGEWDFGNNDAPGSPIRHGDELRFYYSGRPDTHSRVFPAGVTWTGRAGAIGLATLRLDGFVSADGDASGGWLLTRPLMLSGERLFVNANATDGGLVVEVLDEHGHLIEPFSCDSFQTIDQDLVRAECRWDGPASLASLQGAPVRLRFHLHGASLYAFWCE
jgi:hypothetical protein